MENQPNPEAQETTQPPTPQHIQKPKSNKWLVIVLVILLLASLGVAGYFGWQNYQLKKQAVNIESAPTPSLEIPSPAPTSLPTPQATATVDTPDTEEALDTETVSYNSKTDWQTYTDNVSGFSIQYSSTAEIFFSEEGKRVSFNSCHTMPSGERAGEKVCLGYFSLSTFYNYNGGSRRVWLKNNLHTWCEPVYYKNLIVDNVKALLAVRECGSSWGETFVAIPKGDKMILLDIGSGSINPDTKEISTKSASTILSTFKFVQ